MHIKYGLIMSYTVRSDAALGINDLSAKKKEKDSRTCYGTVAPNQGPVLSMIVETIIVRQQYYNRYCHINKSAHLK